MRSSRTVVGDFALKAQAVDRHLRRHRRQPRPGAQDWPERLGEPPRRMICGVPDHVDGRMLGITEAAGAQRHQPRPHVALHRGHPELEPDLAAARHPHPAGPVLALARRARQAPAGAAVPRLRHARHARAHHDDAATTTPGSCSARRSSSASSPSPARSRTPTSPAAAGCQGASAARGAARPAPVRAFMEKGADFIVERDLARPRRSA